MRKGEFLLIFALIVTFIFITTSCDVSKSDNPVGPDKDDKIKYDNEINLINTQSSAGSIISINKENHPLNGMKINIPIDAFKGSRTFNISSSEIKSHSFGQYFNPITPMIRITSNGGYADGLFEVTIPIKLESGSFPLVFIYDDINKKLEPLPIQRYTSSSVTFTTRHFATSRIMSQNSKGKTPIIQSDEAYSNIIVSSLQESIINQTPIISSGFKPGIDDWEFPNYGSYIAPSGHCAGQNMAAFWYYFEKKLKGGPNLFNLMSKFDMIWEENNLGYRFCSTIQKDLTWEGTFINFFYKYIDKNQEMDKMKFYMIAAAILITGEPQGIGVYFQNGTKSDGSPNYAGHDLICYQLEPASGKLYISDPNYPAKGQVINFKNDKFEPYQARLNARLNPLSFPFITYYAKTAYIEWDKIGTRWKEIETKKIGNDKFPTVKFWTTDNGGTYLEDEFDYNIDTLNLLAETPTADAGYIISGKKCAKITIYDEYGNLLYNGNSKTKLRFTEPKLYKFGVLVEGFTNKSKDNSGNYLPEYIDFNWITINYSKYLVKIIPDKMQGNPNQEYTWNLDISTLPKDLKYYIKWNFSDGKGDIRKDNINYINVTYQTSGKYKIYASIFDAKTNALLAKDSAYADIASAANFSPSSGPAGQTAIIKGTGFKDSKYSQIDATLHYDADPTNHSYIALQTKVIDDNTIETIINDHSTNKIGKVFIKLRKNNNQTSKYEWAGPWEFVIGKINVNNIKPDTMRSNSLVTITGSGFGQYFPNDNIKLGITFANKIISWTDTKIEFEAPIMSSNGNQDIFISKSCSNDNCQEHLAGNKYWEPLSSDIITLMKTAYKEGFGKVAAEMICNFKYYNDKGEITSQKEQSHKLDESLNSTSSQNTFKTSSRNFEGVVYKNPYGKVTYNGTISADGKKAEQVTIIRYNENNKIIQKIVFNNLPIKSVNKLSPRVSWIYEDDKNAGSYISEFYYAVYMTNGKLQYDATMKSCSKLTFDFQFEFK